MAEYREENFLKDLKRLGIPEGLPEVVFEGKTPPSADALKRIKKKTLERVQGQALEGAGEGLKGPAAESAGRPGRGDQSGRRAGHRIKSIGGIRNFRISLSRRFKTAAVAAVLVAVVATGWMGPSRVWAGLQRALSLVPGFGLFEGSGEEFPLLVAEPVRSSHGGGYLQVSGVLAQPVCTFVSLYSYMVPGFNDLSEVKEPPTEGQHSADFEEKKRQAQSIYLVDQKGREYRMGESGTFGWSGSTREAHVSFQLPALDPDTRQVTLVVPLRTGEEIRIEVPLVSLAEAGEWGELAHTVTAGGVTISAMALFSEDTRVSLFILPGSGREVDSIGRYFGNLPATRAAVMRGERGQEYEFLRQGQAGWQQLYYELFYDGVLERGEDVTFSIPVLLLAEDGETRVKVPVSREGGSWELNQAVTLGRFELTLVRAEVVSYRYGDNLRVYVDLGPTGAETLESFTLESQSWSWKANEETGQMEYFEVGLQEEPRHVQFTFTRPVYSVEGPWEFTFTAE